MKPDIEPKVLEKFLDVLADLFCDVNTKQQIYPKRLRSFALALDRFYDRTLTINSGYLPHIRVKIKLLREEIEQLKGIHHIPTRYKKHLLALIGETYDLVYRELLHQEARSRRLAEWE